MKSTQLRFSVLCLSGLLMSAGFASAQDWPNLLMTNEQRKLINEQREQYFKPPQVQESASFSGEFNLNKTLRVSAIIRQAEGMNLARINGVIYKQGEHKDNIFVHQIAEQSVDLSINGKRGTAYMGIEYSWTSWPKPPAAKITFGD